MQPLSALAKTSEYYVVFFTGLALALVIPFLLHAVHIAPNDHTAPLKQAEPLYYATDDTLTLQQVRALPQSLWQPVSNPTSFGQIRQNIWLQVPISNPDEHLHQWVLDTKNNHLSEGEIYLLTADKPAPELLYSYRHPRIRTLTYNQHQMAAKFTLTGHEHGVLIIRYRSLMSTHLHLDFQNAEVSLYDYTRDTLVTVIGAAIIFCLGFVNFLLYFSLKKKQYLLYTLQQLFIVLALILNSSLTPDAFFAKHDIFIPHLQVFTFYGSLWSAWIFSYYLLDLKQHFPRIHQVIAIHAVVSVLFLGAALMTDLKHLFAVGTQTLVALTFFLIILYAARLAFQKHTIAIMYLLAMTVYAVNFGLYALVYDDVLRWEPVEHIEFAYIGNISEAILLSLIMSIQLRRSRLQQEKTKAELMTIYEEQIAEAKIMHDLDREKVEAVEEKIAKVKHLASASHDIYQHLLVMRVNLDLIKTQVADDKYIERFESAIQYLEEITHDILKVSKQEAMHDNRIHLPFLFQSIADDLAPLAEASAVTLKYRACRKPLDVSDVILRRILENLIRNAIQNSPHGKVLFVARSKPGGCRLQVMDTGKGMSQEQCEALMGAFTRQSSQAYEGFGLGLFIVSTLCKQAGFDLQVSSTPGKGTVFSVFIPHS